MAIDLPTLMLAGSFVTAASGLFLVFAWMQNREAIGMLWWATGNLVLAAAVPVVVPARPAAVPELVEAARSMLGPMELARILGGQPETAERKAR